MLKITALSVIYILSISNICAQGVKKYQTHAVVYSENRAMITSPINALVEHLSILEGQYFKSGDTLIKFDCTVIAAKRDKAKAIVNETKAELDNSKRLLRLGGTNQQEVKRNLSKYEQALADFKKEDYYFRFCDYKAPFDGQLIKLYVRKHEQVKEGAKLFELVNEKTLLTRLFIPSTWLRWVKKGQPFKLYINETKTSYTAKVSRIIYAVDPVSQTTMLIGHIENSDKRLHSGMSGEALFEGPAGE